VVGGDDVPETRFAKLGDDRIAYQVVGEGPPDLLWMNGFGEPVDSRWDYPPCAGFVRRLASFSRLIMFDRRGVGASDPVSLESLPSWEGWVDDALAVLDTVGSEQAVILGATQGGPTAIMFAATRPERTQALILANTAARFAQADDYPWGVPQEETDAAADFIAEYWGTEAAARIGFPSLMDDPIFVRWVAKSCRMSCSGREMATYIRQDTSTDVRQVLPSVQAPTLVLHRSDPPFLNLDQGRHLAEHIPGATLVEVPGTDIAIYTKPNAQILDHIEAFVTGTSPEASTDRALATILFTDIVSSTERAAELGDRRWRNVLETYLGLTRTIVEEHRGRVIKSDGDGMLATFDGPGRAVRCVAALVDGIRPLGLEIRAGLHTGEVEVMGDDVGGIAVHIAARVMAEAGPSELLVSSVIPPLVAGSAIDFVDRGEYDLKGVPGTWRLFVVQD
jgi:class 3 adenylate cyclase/alpha-beta hydrolase superfamily lysophospholipase